MKNNNGARMNLQRRRNGVEWKEHIGGPHTMWMLRAKPKRAPATATTADHLLVAAAAVAHLGPRLSSGGVEWYKEGQQATERMERI